jgi:6-phosphogluconolactonase (cycloisomerase 2 family)
MNRIWYLLVIISALCRLNPAVGQTFPDSTADVVIGQSDFGSNGTATSATAYNFPAGLALDTTVVPAILYVTDQVNHRIMGYYNYELLQNGSAADFVIGQSNFTSSGNSTTDSTLNQPQGLAVDGSGNLFVVDKLNHRILIFLTPTLTDFKADFVMGQSGSFLTATSNNGGISDTSINQPTAICFGDSNRLYIADGSNNRVLVYNDPLGTDFQADYVIGQPDFTSGGSSTTDSTFNFPAGVAVNSSGDVFVTDFNNNRMLQFNDPLHTDTKADQVFGQEGTYTSGSANNPSIGSESLYQPMYVWVDKDDNVYLEDDYNHRILVFESSPMDYTADHVYGQGGSFTSNTGGVSAINLDTPRGLLVDHYGNLLVADHVNHRVLKFLKESTANIYLDAHDIAFGAINYGTLDTLTFPIFNSGLDTLLIDSILVQSTHLTIGNNFTILDSIDTVTATPADTMHMRVEFAGTPAGSYADSLVLYFRTAGGSATDSTTVSVSGQAESIRLAGTSGAFGAVLVDSTRDVGFVTIRNMSAGSIDITGVTPSDAAFSIVSPSFPATILSDTSETFMVRFAPTTTGDIDGTLSFDTSSVAHPGLVYNVSGTGVYPNAGKLQFVEYNKNDSLGNAGLDGAYGVNVSPDGKHVYTSSQTDHAIAIFDRDMTTGALTYLDDVTNAEIGGTGLGGAENIAFSPDGRHVYANGYADNAISVFSRDATTGLLTFVEAITNTDIGGTGLATAERLACSPDGAHVYVTGRGDAALTVFRRDNDTGRLTFIEVNLDGQDDGHGNTIDGMTDAVGLVISPDGKSVYTASPTEHTVSMFSREPKSGGLTYLGLHKDTDAGGSVQGLGQVYGLAISNDGLHVFAVGTSDDAVVSFSRDTTTGVLTAVEYYQDGGVDAEGNTIDGLDGAFYVAVGPESEYVYAVGAFDNTLAVFKRNKSTGHLTFLEYHLDGGSALDGLGTPRAVTVAPDGKHVYAVGNADDAVAVFAVKAIRSLTGASAHFSAVLVDSTRSVAMVTVRNNSAETAQITDVFWSGSDFFVNTSGFPVDIAGDSAFSFPVSFTPPDTGYFATPLMISVGNPPGASLTFFVSGTGVTPGPGSLSFVEYVKDDSNGVLGLNQVMCFSISPDGANIYAAGYGDNALVVFGRNSLTGTLTYLENFVNADIGGAGVQDIIQTVVSPDGANVYTACLTDDAVSVFARDPVSGLLTFLEIEQNGVNSVTGLDGLRSIAISPDGGYVYVAGTISNAVAIFRREHATGSLTFVDDITNTDIGGTGLSNAGLLTVSPDGKNLYAGEFGGTAFAVFNRNAATGLLTFLEFKQNGTGDVTGGLNGLMDVTVSPEGTHVYTSAFTNNAVAVFSRDTTDGTLTFVEYNQHLQDDGNGNTVQGLEGVYAATVSPDGRIVYAAGNTSNAVSVFNRNPADGSLEFLEYIKDDSAGVNGLALARYVQFSPDARHVYVSGTTDNAIAVFRVKQYYPTGDCDLDGNITAVDASAVLQCIIRRLAFNALQTDAADVSGNGEIRAYDASLILQKVAGYITTFPAGSTFVAKPAAVADADVTMDVALGNDHSVTVTINAIGIHALSSAELTLEYDQDHLEYLGYALPGDRPGFYMETLDEEGTLSLAMAAAQPWGTDGPMVRLRFRLLDDIMPQSQIELTLVYLDEQLVLDAAKSATIAGLPTNYAISQNYPNPFNPVTTIRYQIPEDVQVRITVHNLLGQVVATLVDEQLLAGYYSKIWDGQNHAGLRVASGVYLYRIQAGNFIKTKKMLLLK